MSRADPVGGGQLLGQLLFKRSLQTYNKLSCSKHVMEPDFAGRLDVAQQIHPFCGPATPDPWGSTADFLDEENEHWGSVAHKRHSSPDRTRPHINLHYHHHQRSSRTLLLSPSTGSSRNLLTPRTVSDASTAVSAGSWKLAASDTLAAGIEDPTAEDPTLCPAALLDEPRWKQAWQHRKNSMEQGQGGLPGTRLMPVPLNHQHSGLVCTRDGASHVMARCGGSVPQSFRAERVSLTRSSSDSPPALAGLTSYFKFVKTKYPNAAASASASFASKTWLRESTFQKPQPGDFLGSRRSRRTSMPEFASLKPTNSGSCAPSSSAISTPTAAIDSTSAAEWEGADTADTSPPTEDSPPSSPFGRATSVWALVRARSLENSPRPSSPSAAHSVPEEPQPRLRWGKEGGVVSREEDAHWNFVSQTVQRSRTTLRTSSSASYDSQNSYDSYDGQISDSPMVLGKSASFEEPQLRAGHWDIVSQTLTQVRRSTLSIDGGSSFPGARSSQRRSAVSREASYETPRTSSGGASLAPGVNRLVRSSRRCLPSEGDVVKSAGRTAYFVQKQ